MLFCTHVDAGTGDARPREEMMECDKESDKIFNLTWRGITGGFDDTEGRKYNPWDGSKLSSRYNQTSFCQI